MNSNYDRILLIIFMCIDAFMLEEYYKFIFLLCLKENTGDTVPKEKEIRACSVLKGKKSSTNSMKISLTSGKLSPTPRKMILSLMTCTQV